MKDLTKVRRFAKDQGIGSLTVRRDSWGTPSGYYRPSGDYLVKPGIRIRCGKLADEKLVVWALLHELGHHGQYQTGYLNNERTRRLYSDLRIPSAERYRVEQDAWRRAGRLAVKLGIEVDDEMREYGRKCLATYKRTA